MEQFTLPSHLPATQPSPFAAPLPFLLVSPFMRIDYILLLFDNRLDYSLWPKLCQNTPFASALFRAAQPHR